jgi:hypothetical protein
MDCVSVTNIEQFDESEEQEELVEPRFRYKRILGDLVRVFFYLVLLIGLILSREIRIFLELKVMVQLAVYMSAKGILR